MRNLLKALRKKLEAKRLVCNYKSADTLIKHSAFLKMYDRISSAGINLSINKDIR